jgi:hypothetical protein
MAHLGRREFISVLGGAVAWPSGVYAQAAGCTRDRISRKRIARTHTALSGGIPPRSRYERLCGWE